MSTKELDRVGVLIQVKAKKLFKTEAAKMLGITRQHLDRLYKKFCRHGPEGLISGRRGKPSNNRIPNPIRESIVTIIREKYHDFRPTLTHEKLTEVHGFCLSNESVRQIMIHHGIWQGRHRKPVRVHQMRDRRPRLGELVQIDGSPHDWFEGRRESCCLLVFIDDATSCLLGLLFVENECLEGYFDLMKDYLGREGRPLSIYSDRHTIFHVPNKEFKAGTGETQFGRAMRQLNIESIPAGSPQAKGRVERANGILQDRLVKEMRLLAISDIPTANIYLPTFMADYNKRFAHSPLDPINAHRKQIPQSRELGLILSIQEQRILSKNLELSYKNVIYQIQSKTPGYRMRRAAVTVCESHGRVSLLHKGKTLLYKTFDKKNRPKEAVSGKELNSFFDKRLISKTAKSSHPWKQNYPYPSKTVAAKMSHLSTVLPKQSDSYLSSASESYG